MQHVGIKQARQALPDLIDRAEAGEEFIITRRGRPVAKLIGASRLRKPLPTLADFRSSIRHSGTTATQRMREEREAD